MWEIIFHLEYIIQQNIILLERKYICIENTLSHKCSLCLDFINTLKKFTKQLDYLSY